MRSDIEKDREWLFAVGGFITGIFVTIVGFSGCVG